MHSSLSLSLSVKTFHQKQTGDLQSSGLGLSGTTICNQLIISFPSLHYSLWLFSQALISAATLRNKASRKNPVALLLTTISVLPNLSFFHHHRNRYEDFPNSSHPLHTSLNPSFTAKNQAIISPPSWIPELSWSFEGQWGSNQMHFPLLLLITPQHTCQRNNMTSTQNKKHKKPQQAVVKAKAKQGLQS